MLPTSARSPSSCRGRFLFRQRDQRRFLQLSKRSRSHVRAHAATSDAEAERRRTSARASAAGGAQASLASVAVTYGGLGAFGVSATGREAGAFAAARKRRRQRDGGPRCRRWRRRRSELLLLSGRGTSRRVLFGSDVALRMLCASLEQRASVRRRERGCASRTTARRRQQSRRGQLLTRTSRLERERGRAARRGR